MLVFYNDESVERIYMQELLGAHIEFSQPLLFKELEMETDSPHIHWG